jgi:hypothetical protein
VESSSGDLMRRVIKVYTRSKSGSEILLWQADLLNCPVQIFVSPGGKVVATMDQWGRIGSDALVFYAAGGAVLKRYERAEGELITDSEAARATEVRKLVPLGPRSARWIHGEWGLLGVVGVGASDDIRRQERQPS